MSSIGGMSNPLFVRPVTGRVVAGVCAAIANRYLWDVTNVRIAAALLILCTGVGGIAYVALWIAIPSEW